MSEAAAVRAPERRRWRWVAFFAVLAALAAAAVALPIVYNLGQLLRPEQLEEARRRWQANGPADYDLTFSVRYDRDAQAERHIVLVRGGRVVYAACEGELRYVGGGIGALAGLPAGGVRRGPVLDVPAILGRIERLLEEARERGGRDFLVATFHGDDGHPRRIIRRVRGTSTREEWNIRLWPAGALGAGPGGGGGPK
jgi:hypothetical protein